MESHVPSKLVVVGRIANARNEPLAGRTVRAFDRDPERGELELGPAAATDAEGRYTIGFTTLDLTPGRMEGGGPDVFVRVFDGGGGDGSGEAVAESETRLHVKRRVTLNVVVPERASEPAPEPKEDPKDPVLRVHGIVRNEVGELLTNVTVSAFDRDLRSEQLLGSSPVKKGRYEIKYKRSQFNKAEKKAADLVLKVLERGERERFVSPIHYNAPPDLEWDLSLSGKRFAGPADWQVLTDSLTPLLDGVAPKDLREDEQFEDISFLAGETDRSRLDIGRWIACFRLADKTDREEVSLAPEVFFAFLGQGQPSIFYDSLIEDMQHPDRVALLEDKILRALAELTPDLQESLLRKATDENLIPARVAPQIEEILGTLGRIKLRYASEGTFGGGKGTISELLELTPTKKEDQAAFVTAFAAHTGPLTAFWQKIEEDKVLEPDVVQQVKLTFALGALTRNHIPLVGALLERFQRGELDSPRELARLGRSEWTALFRQARPGREADRRSGRTSTARRTTSGWSSSGRSSSSSSSVPTRRHRSLESWNAPRARRSRPRRISSASSTRTRGSSSTGTAQTTTSPRTRTLSRTSTTRTRWSRS